MITTHRYLQDAESYTGGVPIVPSGRYPDVWYGFEGTYSPGGIHSEEFFKSFVRTNENVFLVNCGHFHAQYRQASANWRGAPIHEVLADYQDDANGGNGFLRLMNFDVRQGRINVESYSPWLNQSYTTDESRFSLNVDFNRYRSTTGHASFQDGINGYSGTRDTWINEGAPNTSYGNNPTFVVDDDTRNSIFTDYRGQGLVGFDNIITNSNEPGKIPAGSLITEATFRLVLEDDIDFIFDADFQVYMMTRDWSESSTWNSLQGGLTQGADYGMYIGELEGDNNPDGDYWRWIDVTVAVQAWANGAPNYGFAIIPEIIPGNDDGITVWASEAGNILYRPRLDVRFVSALVPGPGVLAVAAAFGVLASRQRRIGR
jgi:hypothetical protein